MVKKAKKKVKKRGNPDEMIDVKMWVILPDPAYSALPFSLKKVSNSPWGGWAKTKVDPSGTVAFFRGAPPGRGKKIYGPYPE